MNLRITTEKTGDEAILRLNGELNITGSPILDDEVKVNIDGITLLTLDFTDCDYVSSAGVRSILEATQLMEAKNGKLRLTNVGPQFMSVLQTIGLDEAIDLA